MLKHFSFQFFTLRIWDFQTQAFPSIFIIFPQKIPMKNVSVLVLNELYYYYTKGKIAPLVFTPDCNHTEILMHFLIAVGRSVDVRTKSEHHTVSSISISCHISRLVVSVTWSFTRVYSVVQLPFPDWAVCQSLTSENVTVVISVSRGSNT